MHKEIQVQYSVLFIALILCFWSDVRPCLALLIVNQFPFFWLEKWVESF